jgi:hypothetical protein
MARALVHNLPKFREGAPFPRPDRPNEWVEEHGSLKRLGQSLDVDDQPFVDPDEPIRAIPDPWAQARTFAEAVIDPEHSMHAAFVAQWRGLLATFALRKECKSDYSIDARALDLSGTHIFDKVLSRLSPRIAIGDKVNLWTSPGIVYVTPAGRRAMPVAMLNPACLVSPGRLAAHIDVAHVAWLKGGIRDPLAIALPSNLLVVLRAWIEKLREQLAAFPGSPAGDAIRHRLQQFADDIDAQIGISPLSATASSGSNPDLPDLYQGLWTSAVLEEIKNPAATSRTRLALKDSTGRGGLQGVILVDESLVRLGTTGDGRDVTVWGAISLAELLNSRPRFDATRREAAARGFVLATADDLFTSRLVRLHGNPHIPGHPRSFNNMLLPVRPIALLLEGHLPSMLEADGDAELCTVTLKLTLEGDDGKRPDHQIVRHFRKGAMNSPELVDEVPWAIYNASVWPDFKSKKWSSYYAHFLTPVEDFEVRPQVALSSPILDAALEGTAEPAEAVLALQRISSTLGLDTRQDWNRRSVCVTEFGRDVVQASNLNFEAIFYDERNGGANVGCVWLDIKPIEVAMSQTAVAVDFGTTNTVACFKDRKPIVFQERLVHPISYESATTVRNYRATYKWMFVDFMPPDARQLPTPTVALARKGMEKGTDSSFFKNIIYFSPPAVYAANAAKSEIDKYQRDFSRAMFNLKWSDDPLHVNAASDFLGQLMLMIAAEAAGRNSDPRQLSWRFSLPDSMPQRVRNNFKGHLNELTKKISPEGALEGFYSEGVAAARYMLAGNAGARVVPGTINAVLDIGGGTTDVTLWANDRQLWRGSFRLAGQSFFTNTIVQNPHILREIGLDDWADLFDPPESSVQEKDYKNIDKDDFPHLAELLFSGPALSRALDEHWAKKLNLKTGETLRAAALVFIGGLAHYLGLVARKLAEDHEGGDLLAKPSFSLCGRGAGLFARIHGKTPSEGSSDVTEALTLFSRAAGTAGSPRPRLVIEPETKLEVVRGMVIEYKNIDAREHSRSSAQSDHLPAGVDIRFIGGTMLAAEDEISAQSEARGVAQVDVSGIETMLERLEEHTGIGVDMRRHSANGAYEMICNEVRSHVDASRGEEGALSLSEPPYITGLRQLINEIALPEGRPDRGVTIEVGA